MFKKLLQNLQLDGGLAEKTAQAVMQTQAPAPVGSPLIGQQDRQPNPSGPIQLMQVDDLLSIPGYTQAVVDKLRPFVVVLPKQTKINVNTAPAEVLSLTSKDLTLADAAALVERRKQAHFFQDANFITALAGHGQNAGSFGVLSEYFLVSSKVRLDRAALDSEALIQRNADVTHSTSIVWIRQN
jgi:general secretion pathway protein K